jgi:hypothetical protein
VWFEGLGSKILRLVRPADRARGRHKPARADCGQRGTQWIDADEAQTPPRSSDLFGIAMTANDKGFYYVEDDVNTLMLAR